MGNSSFRQRFNLSRLAIRYSRLTIAIWLGIAVAGIIAFCSMKYALFPDISFPVVVVNAQAPIKTLAKTETELTHPLEAKLLTLEDSPQVFSQTYAERSVVSIFFDAGVNLAAATETVKTAIANISLPPAASVKILPVDLNESPVISYALTSQTRSLEELGEIAQQNIIPKIENLSGIGKVNLLGDYGELSLENTEDEVLPTRVNFNGQEALGLQVVKQGEANTLEVVNQVESLVQRLKPEITDFELNLAETQAHFISSAVDETIHELILALILATAIVFPFLKNWRATIITALAIPLSLLATGIVMAISGLTLEIITLLALALVIGTVIDDAIVDVENIARLVDAGRPPKAAAIEGTDEIGLTMTASSLAVVAVFLPVMLMRDTVGTFFKPFGLTVSAAVIFSLLVARTLSPVLAVYWLKPKAQTTSKKASVDSQLIRRYRQLLRWSLSHRQIVMYIALASLIAGLALIPFIPKGFIPKLDRGEFIVNYTTPLPKLPSFEVQSEPEIQTTEGSSEDIASEASDPFDWIGDIRRSPERLLLRKTIKVGKQLESEVLSLPDMQSTLVIAGTRGNPTLGKLYVQLKDDRSLTTAEVQEQVRQTLPSIKGVTVSVEDIPFVQTDAEKPLQFVLLSQALSTLDQSAQTLIAQVKSLPGLVDVELSQTAIKTERLDGEYATFLNANLAQNKGLEDAAVEIEAIAKNSLPENVRFDRWGTAAQSSTVLASFGVSLSISVVLMILVLFFLFRSFLEPLVIGLSLPLSLVGAMLGLLITGSDFALVTLIGFMFLVGLLAKNALLLMDYAKQLRQQGVPREQALIETGAVRLRPIIMTTASSILGMLPIALGWGPGAELRQPMAVAILGGLATSSLLSLIVVPVLYTILDDFYLKFIPKVNVTKSD